MSARRLFVLSVLVILGLGAGQAAWASGDHMKGGHGIKTMANIMMHLNHRPSASEKATLRDIINDGASSENEKVLAQAMINLEHRAAAGDVNRLRAVMNDDSATRAERTMAEIILGLNHKPSSSDKDKLRRMAK